MIEMYEKIGLMGLVTESSLKKYEKYALLETIKESNDIEVITSLLVEFKVVDEQKASFLSKVGGGLKSFGKKVRGKWGEFEKGRQKRYQSQVRTHLTYSQSIPPPAGIEASKEISGTII